jgi:Uncharacterised protein family (UPF0236)
MEPVRSAGRVFSPLDEELALLPGSLTPKHQEHLAHLGSWMPFERAAQMLETLVGVQVSEPTVRRGTERMGAHCERQQMAQSQQPVSPDSGSRRSCEKQVISTDGAFVPLVAGAWAEVRTVAIAEVKQASETTEQVQVHQLSYFSRMSDANTFADLAEVEMRRRGVSHARAVCAVNDGAPWIQGFIDLHRHDAVRILDFPHAAEHLGLLIEALKQANVVLPDQVLQRSLHVLKHRGPSLLLRWYERLPETIKALEAVQKQWDYFGKRLNLMQYPDYQQQGWPIGSGMVESANKVVVQARLKGAGMHWKPIHVNPMLTLRTAVCNERWNEVWQDTLKERHEQIAHTRQHQAETRLQSCLSSILLLLLRSHPFAPPPKPTPATAPREKEPAATLPGSSHPSALHPWKRWSACGLRSVAKI